MNSAEPETRFVFVTGGVLSGIGKGVTTASLAKLFQFRGYTVRIIKIDPYLNIDPGTLNPIEHGEVFVTDKTWVFVPVPGFEFLISEIDQDFGTYERFTGIEVSPSQNITSGQIYISVILGERRGSFLGRTVQIIPHVTDAIKKRIWEIVDTPPCPDVVLVEIGGTVGDIEAMPFLEAVRQLVLEVGRSRVALVHVTLVPYMKSVGEFKTKPTQHSVRTLQGLGLQPDIIVCRADKELGDAARAKIALFCNVPESRVISNPDIPVTYELPLSFERQGLGKILVEHFQMEHRKPDTGLWERVVSTFQSCTGSIAIAMPGKYTSLSDSYKSINEALRHAGAACGVRVDVRWIDTDDDPDVASLLAPMEGIHGILLTPGFGARGVEGMINAATISLDHGIPFLGICYGAQLGTVAFARKMMGWKDAHTTEVNPHTSHPVVDLLEEQRRTQDKGGTMRLGGQEIRIVEGTRLHELYGEKCTRERFRHRYHLINDYVDKMREKGMVVSAYDSTGRMVNAVEVTDHPFWIGVQYHPEFRSRPGHPHPLYLGFVKAAIQHQKRGGGAS